MNRIASYDVWQVYDHESLDENDLLKFAKSLFEEGFIKVSTVYDKDTETIKTRYDMTAIKEEILDIAYELGQCSSGYYQEDKRKSKKQWILDILEYSYDTNDNLSRYQESSNREIENAIFNGTHKDIVEYFDLEVY